MIVGGNEPRVILSVHDYMRLERAATRSGNRKRALRAAHKAYMVLKAEHLALKARADVMQRDLSIRTMIDTINRQPVPQDNRILG
jgi:hypothetical protein